MPEPSPRFVWLTRLAFWLAAVLATARAMTLIYLRDVEPVVPLPPGEPMPLLAPGPATQAWLDAACLIPACLVLLRWAFDRTFVLARTPSVVAMALLAGWAFASFAWAFDPFAAAVNGSLWIGAAALFFAISNTTRTWGDFRLILGLAAGLLAVNVLAGLYFIWIDHPETVAMVEENRNAVLAARGMEPGSFKAEQFLGRVLRGEFAGFAASPNSYAATLLCLGLATAGVGYWRGRRGAESAWGWAVLIPLVPAAYLLWRTGSRTALIIGAACVGLLVGGWLLRERLAAHRKLALLTLGLLALLGIAGVVGVGLATGTLPHVSLRFRWYYWTGAWGVFRDSPLLGCGFASFGDAYLAHRPMPAAEEVSDPHNWIVRFFSELGLVGGSLAMGWVALLVRELTRPALPQEDIVRSPMAPRSLRGIVGLVVAAIALHLALTIDTSAPADFVLLDAMKRGVFGLALLGITLLVACYQRDDPRLDLFPMPLVAIASAVAVAGVFLHALLDVSLFEQTVLMVVTLLAGATAGIRGAAGRPRVPIAGRFAGAALALGLAVAFVALFAFPLGMAERAARSGDFLLRTSRPADAVERYAAAAWWSPAANAGYADRAATAARFARDGDAAVDWMERAIEARPRSTRLRVELAELLDLSGRRDDALAAFEAAVEINPNEIGLRRRIAQAYAAAGRPAEAARQLRAALAVSDAFAPDEPERLSDAERAAMLAEVEALDRSGG